MKFMVRLLIEIVFIYVILVVLHLMFSSVDVDLYLALQLPLAPVLVVLCVALLASPLKYIAAKLFNKSPSFERQQLGLETVMIFIMVYVYFHFVSDHKDTFMNRLNRSSADTGHNATHIIEPSTTHPRETVSSINVEPMLSYSESVLFKPSAEDEELSIFYEAETLKHFVETAGAFAISGDWESFLSAIKDGGGINASTDEMVLGALVMAVGELAPMRVISELLSMGGELNADYRHLAFHLGDAKYVKQLVETGLPLDGYDSIGHTALTSSLSYPPSKEQLGIVRYLVEAGGDVNEVDSVGHSPMHYALSHEGDDYSVAIIKVLVDSGVEFTTSDKETLNAIKADNPYYFTQLTATVPDIKKFL